MKDDRENHQKDLNIIYRFSDPPLEGLANDVRSFGAEMTAKAEFCARSAQILAIVMKIQART